MNNANYVMRNNTPAAPGCCRSNKDCGTGSWCQSGGKKTPIYDDYYQCHGMPDCKPPVGPTPSPTPSGPTPSPTPSGPTPGLKPNCCYTKADCNKNSYCMIKAGKGPWSCHGPGPSCNPPPSPPGPAGPSGPSGSLDWCQTEWKNIGGNAANPTYCSPSGLCHSPHGLDCCSPPSAKYPSPTYPCKGDQGKFCKTFVNAPIENLKQTGCPVTFYECDFNKTGDCKPCDPRTNPTCLASQYTKENSCNDVGCFKIPPINKNNKGPKTVWKLANNAAEAQKNAPYLTIWAEGAGGLGEGSVGISPKLVQYYRGMADFFRRVDTDSEILKCNRLQVRVENPYIDGPTPVKNMYFPSITSPIFTELLSNLPRNVTVQFMPWTHEPWIQYSKDCKTKYKNVPIGGKCNPSSIPCYPSPANLTGIYKSYPTCKDGLTVMNGDCYTMTDGKCVDHADVDMCSGKQICAQKTGQKWPGCITQCCTTQNEIPRVCDGGARCCTDSKDCPRVPALAVCLANDWNVLLEAQGNSYKGPYITGLAFDAEGSGYSATNLSKYARQALYAINNGTDYCTLKTPDADLKGDQFVLSVTQGSSFHGLAAKTIPTSAASQTFNSVQDVVKLVNDVLKPTVANADNVPSIADEVLPEYYNVIDKCKSPETSGAILVDSLPNWKYPDFRDTAKCGPGFAPYVGEQEFLYKKGAQFPCGDPKIMSSTGDCTGGPSPPPGPPSPTLGKYCDDKNRCSKDELCCTCNCHPGDTTIGTFGCALDPATPSSAAKPKPASEQTDCCGGKSGLIAWCAKQGTSSATSPQCSSPAPEAQPNPSSDFYKFGAPQPRCVKRSDGCNTGYCDNPVIPKTNLKESFTLDKQCSSVPSNTKLFPCCGCGYSPSSIYLSAWNARKLDTPSNILWNGTKNSIVYAKKAKLLNGVGPLQHFITGEMTSADAKSQFSVLRTCALLSIESSHGMGTANCMYPIYPPKEGSKDMTANCGIPNAFGCWTGEYGRKQFIEITKLVANGPAKIVNGKGVGVPFGSVGVFSYPLMPNSWLAPKGGKDFPYKPTLKDGGPGGSSQESNLTWLWITLGVLAVLILALLGVKFL